MFKKAFITALVMIGAQAIKVDSSSLATGSKGSGDSSGQALVTKGIQFNLQEYFRQLLADGAMGDIAEKQQNDGSGSLSDDGNGWDQTEGGK